MMGKLSAEEKHKFVRA